MTHRVKTLLQISETCLAVSFTFTSCFKQKGFCKDMCPNSFPRLVHWFVDWWVGWAGCLKICFNARLLFAGCFKFVVLAHRMTLSFKWQAQIFPLLRL